MLPTVRAVLTIGFLSACSGSSGSSDDETGDPSGGSECRAYAARTLSVSELDGNSIIECDFDRSSLAMTCVHYGNPSYIETTTWDTIVAAVNDNRPFGLRTYRLQTLELGSCVFSNEFVYDSGGRLTAMNASTTDDTACGTFNVVYDAWDGQGRWTHGTANGIGVVECMGYDMSQSYDDGTRTVSYADSGGNGTDCRATTGSETFDEDGLLVASTIFSSTTTNTIEERGEICGG